MPVNNTGPCGGGNQFLSGLKDEFNNKNIYTENINEADIILFNSHHNLNNVHYIKQHLPHVKIFHRIDGIHQLWRGEQGKQIDLCVSNFSNNFVDGVIFQSQWSKKIFEQ